MDENMEDIVDDPLDYLNSVYSPDNDDPFGDRQLDPRVGDEYQVEIPELMMEYDGWQLARKPTDLSFTIDFPDCWTVGLPIPVMWMHYVGEEIKKESLEVLGNQDSAVNKSGSVESESSQESQITSNDEDVQPRIEPLSSELNMDHGNNGCYPLPGKATDTWKDIEYDSFVLGLYIFGKKLHLVKKFVESRKMGDILSYYYGKFYRSEEYLRWSKSRKKKTRQRIQGQKIFTGWRQNELLSRISSHVSEECETVLTELNRRFGEGKGKLSLEDYVFSLKNMVGVSVLIESVAIGKGKQDLTATATIDPPKTKTHHLLPIHPELSSGKACSSLTKSEIIKFLSGDIRLSKARSSDLFWEAVWPRLLARGWHSEQPRGQSQAGSKSSLVFLIPGVKRFSRRKLVKGKLVKGTHCFDSVTDVLSKVAAEPELIELESEASQVSAYKESCSDSDVLPNWKRHCYLQPRNSNCNQDSLKFTVVDTSFVCGGKRVKVRDLRSLPVDTINVVAPSAHSSETERDTKKETLVEKEVKNTSKHIVENTMESHDDQRISLPNDRHSRKTLKCIMYSRKGKYQKSNNLDLVNKQNELRACSPDEISEEAVLNTNCVDKEPSPEKTQPQILIDLNFPQVPQTDGSVLNSEMLSPSDNRPGKKQQQPPVIINGQRQSSRNRAMTTRVLEAIEFEFGMSKKKRKAVDAADMSKNSNASRSTSSRRVCGKTADVINSHSDIAGKDGDTNMDQEFLE